MKTQDTCTCPSCGETSFATTQTESSLKLGGTEHPVLSPEYRKCTACGYERVSAELSRWNDKRFGDVRHVRATYELSNET